MESRKMSNENSIQSEIYRQLIRNFLSSLTPNQIDAIGGEPNIRVAFVKGDQQAIDLAERSSLIISPIAPILHIRSESPAHQKALELSYKPFCKAAAIAGFQWLSFSCGELISYAFRARS